MIRIRRWLGHNLIVLGRWVIFGRRRWLPVDPGKPLGADFEAVWDENVDKLHEA